MEILRLRSDAGVSPLFCRGVSSLYCAYISNDVRNKGAEIAARAAAFQEEAPARRDRGKLSHQTSIREVNAGIVLRRGLGIRILHYRE